MKFLSNLFERLFGAKKSQPKAGPPLAEASKAQTTHSFENVVVGKILEINKHPNADRLRLVKVDVGNKELEVVCGASNIAVGQKVPAALVGATLPNGIEIKEVEIRGIKSCGMICAENELGLGKNHNGIMILDEKAEIGMEFAEYINLNK